jgi:hypothetical protein
MSAPPTPPGNRPNAPSTPGTPGAPAPYPPAQYPPQYAPQYPQQYPPGYGYPQYAAPTAPPPKKGSGAAVAAGVIVIVVVLILALAFLGYLPFLPLHLGSNSSSGSSNVASYSQASSAAQSAANSYGSGSTDARAAGPLPAAGDWIEVLAIGYALSSSISESGPIGASTSCAITPFSGSGSLTIPATAGSVSSGLATTWVFEFFSPGDANGLYVVWQGGSATAWGSFSETACIAQPATSYEVPSGVIDSPTATADAGSNASAFLSSNSGVSGAYLLVGGTTTATWDILYTTCTFGSSGSGSWDSTFVNGLDGGVIFSLALTESCSG